MPSLSPRLRLPARLFLERILSSLRDAVLFTRFFGQLCADRIAFPLSAGNYLRVFGNGRGREDERQPGHFADMLVGSAGLVVENQPLWGESFQRNSVRLRGATALHARRKL